MDTLSLFNSTKPFKRIVLPCATSRKLPARIINDDESGITHADSVSEAGTDYAREYVQMEEKQLLAQAASYVQNSLDDKQKFDDISQGTQPVINDVMGKDMDKIYKTYNFAYRPKINLTINSMKDHIVSMIETNSVVIIQGPTGCGKTTQVPQFILDSCYQKRSYCNIIVTQPRRIAAISIAKRVSQERSWPLGTLVGYQVGMINNTSADTRLTYCTTGVLLNRLINSKQMLDYSHVILDEVHERDQDMDFLLIVVRKLLHTNSRNVKVVLMSATINVNRFAKYFSSPLKNKLVPAPIIDIVKQNFFNVNMFYLCQIGTLGPQPEVIATEPKVTHRMMDFCVHIVLVLDDIDKQADDAEFDPETGLFERHVILIFLPGIHEIEEIHHLFSAEKYKSCKWDIVVLHSSITNEAQQRIFEKPPKGFRRIILSTNIAESSITVPDVKYVIDFCLTKQLVTDPATNFQCLQLVWASKANCIQRAGRTGRVMDGRVYRLIPKRFYENVLPDDAEPEMLRAPIETLVLRSKILNMGEPKAILALSLDPPDLSNLQNTILLLKECGALITVTNELDYCDGELTDLGRVMAHLPLNVHISKLIVLGHVFSVLRDSIIIGASMALKDMFVATYGKRLMTYNVKLSWTHRSESDCIAFLHVYKVWINEKANRRVFNNATEKQWAARNLVQIRVLREVEFLVNEITMRLKHLGITETVGVDKVVLNDTERPFILKIVIAGAFYPNYFISFQEGQSNKGDEGMKLLGGLDPTRTVYLQGWPLKQPGMLYARRFQEIFKNCLSSSMGSVKDINVLLGNIKVVFDASSRVFIQFNTNESISTESGPSNKMIPLLRAIKMRQCNMHIEIPVLSEEAAQQRAAELALLSKPCQMFFTEKQHGQIKTSTSYVRSQLPSLDISIIPLSMSHVKDPGHFWARIKDDETLSAMNTIDGMLNRTGVSFPPVTGTPEIGTLVIARTAPLYENIKYCRAIIVNYVSENEQKMAIVFFIDYGITSRIHISDLKEVNKNSIIAKIPALALECVLANVQPSVIQTLTGQWAPASYDLFIQLVDQNSIFGEVYSVVNSVVALNLVCVSKTEEKVSINELLVEQGFAVTKEEDYLSQDNHNLRKKHINMSHEQRQYYEQMQYDETYLSASYPEPPSTFECSTYVHLRGPFSPLEVELSNITKAGRGKKVIVEQNSVNSVLLDPNPKDPHTNFLVAGSVNQNVSGTNLLIRHTTVMPNVDGLPALLALIFTPRMELRCNQFRSYYIGALCGLGCDQYGRSIFPEHDVDLHFDVEISIDDLQDINKLRHWINVGIHVKDQTEENDNMQGIIVCQNRVKDVLFKLIKKERKSKCVETIDDFEKWNRYDESLLLQPGRAPMIKNNIYSLHNAIELEERDKKTETMIAHMKNLRLLAAEDDRKHGAKEITCELCETTVYGIFPLRNHLFDLEHRLKEEKLNIPS